MSLIGALEVELKFRVASVGDVASGLRRLAAREAGLVEQVDQYFAHPVRDFAATDEALRIRRVGERNFVTYKGPKVDATTKTRREMELPLTDGSAAAERFTELLTALGFRPVATVQKTRTMYELTWRDRHVEIAIDRVEHLGTFVEVETQAADSELDAARDAVTSLAKELGLEASERRSYLEMLLA